MDPYKILGIDKGASPDEIRRAYRLKASQYHPDKGGEVWIFQQIQDAYDELTGKRKKRKKAAPSEQKQSQPTDSPDPFGADPFAFDIPEPPPEREYSNSTAHSPKAMKQQRRKVFWMAGAVATAVIILALGGILWWNFGRLVGDRSVASTPHPDQRNIKPNITSSKPSDSNSHSNPSESATEASPRPKNESPPESSPSGHLPSSDEELAGGSTSLPTEPLSSLPHPSPPRNAIISPTIFSGHHSEITELAMSSDGTRLVSAAADSIRMWDFRTGTTIWRSDFLSGKGVPAFRFDPTQRTIWACTTGKTAQFNVATGELIKSFDFGVGGGWDTVVSFTPDCRTLLFRLDDKVQSFDLISGSMVAQRSQWITSVDFSSDSKNVLVGAFEGGGLKMVSMATANEIHTFPKEVARTCAIFSNDDKLIAQWSGPHKVEDKVVHNVKIFDAQTGRQIQVLTGFRGWQYGAAFSPNNKLLATVGSGTHEDWGARGKTSDRAIRVWDVYSGRIVHQFAGHNGSGLVVVFTPDGKKLVTGGIDAMIRIWDLTD